MEDLHTKTLGKLLKGVEGKKYPHGRHPDFSKEKEIYKNSKSKALHNAKKDKFSKAVGKMVNRLDWEHKDTLS